MIVVTGATGNVGRPLVRALAAAGEQVTAVSRGIPGDPLPEGVRHRQADLGDAETLRPVLDGADALFLHDGGGGTQGFSVPDILDVAKAGGVGRVVLLSSQGVGTRPESVSHGVVGRAREDAVRQSGLEWTFLRAGGFDSNAFAWAESVRTRRTVSAPFGDVGLPTVDPDDIAEVAAAVLRGRGRDGQGHDGQGHGGQTYVLTGPAPSTPRQQAEAIGAALGEPVRFVELTADEARAQMLGFMPEPVVTTTLAILGTPTADELRISPDIERILGRPAGTFAAWAERNIAAFG